VYAAKSLSHLRWSGYDRYGIHGEVYLWGALVEHERGWRAQYAYPKSFVLPLEMMPVSVTILEARMAALAAYGCDVSVAGSKGIVPLWRKGSGYDAAGLALLIERCQDWYTRRAQKRRIKRGVRVAILGHGIAVVEQADEVQVTAVLWNQNRLRIGRKAIVWNEGNRRWEASHWAFARQHLARSACRRDLGLLPGLCILKGKAGHTRTIPMPAWVKQVLDPWLQAADINSGKLFRRVRKMGKSWEERLTEKAVWHVVREYAAKSNIDKLAPHDLRRTCARL
jgi:hypothetical protein